MKFEVDNEINGSVKTRKRQVTHRGEEDSLSRIWEKLRRSYPGLYVAVVDDRVVASGRDQLTVYRKAEKGIPIDKEIGIFYVPKKNANPLLLKIRYVSPALFLRHPLLFRPLWEPVLT